MAGPSHDSLTGLPNVETFLTSLRRRLDDDDRRPLAVGVFDVADFAAVNDHQGHATGDRVLREVAVRLAGALRPTDLLARVGGDEFGVICLDVSAEEADHLANDAATAVRTPIGLDGLVLEVTVTSGVAHLAADAPAPTPEALLAEARSRR